MLSKRLAFLKKLASLFLFCGFLTSSALANNQVDLFPTEIKPCLLKKTEEQILISHIDNINEDYYLFRISQKLPHELFPDQLALVEGYLGVKLDRLGCLVVIPPDNKKLTWNKFVPTAIAQQFALDDIQYDIDEQGGKGAYQRSLAQYPRDAGSGPWIYFPEDAWAMKELQIPFPEPYVIVNSTDELPQEPE